MITWYHTKRKQNQKFNATLSCSQEGRKEEKEGDGREEEGKKERRKEEERGGQNKREGKEGGKRDGERDS